MRKGKTDDPLFISNRGTHLSRDAVEGIVRRHVGEQHTNRDAYARDWACNTRPAAAGR